MSGRMIIIVRTLSNEIKKVEELEGATKSYRRQFGEPGEISVSPLTKLIMDVTGIPP